MQRQTQVKLNIFAGENAEGDGISPRALSPLEWGRDRSFQNWQGDWGESRRDGWPQNKFGGPLHAQVIVASRNWYFGKTDGLPRFHQLVSFPRAWKFRGNGHGSSKLLKQEIKGWLNQGESRRRTKMDDGRCAEPKGVNNESFCLESANDDAVSYRKKRAHRKISCLRKASGSRAKTNANRKVICPWYASEGRRKPNCNRPLSEAREGKSYQTLLCSSLFTFKKIVSC